MLYLLAR
jgi:hypothetical protein